MNNLNLTILEENQLSGSGASEIFKKRGMAAAISDYALCCGGGAYYNLKEAAKYNSRLDIPLEHRLGIYWTKTPAEKNNAKVVSYFGLASSYTTNQRNIGIRPVLPFSSISDICSNRVRAQDGILEVECGEYLQQVISQYENKYAFYNYEETGKRYTRYSQCEEEFAIGVGIENENHFMKCAMVKVVADAEVPVNDGRHIKGVILSDGKIYETGHYVRMKVEPIKWWVDEKNNIAVAEKVLFAGVPFKNSGYYNGDFEHTDLYQYMDTYLSKEILPTKNYISINDARKSDKKNLDYELTQEIRKPIITESSLTHKTGINIIFELPQNFEIKDILTQTSDNDNIRMMIENSNDQSKQKTYKIEDTRFFSN